jgi:hypothetical protein
VRFRVCSLSRSFGNCWMVNLRLDRALMWKVENHQLGRSVSVIWQAGSSKVVALACVGLVPMDWRPRASIEYTDRMPVMWPSKLSRLPLIDIWLKRTTSMVVLGEKLRRVP